MGIKKKLNKKFEAAFRFLDSGKIFISTGSLESGPQTIKLFKLRNDENLTLDSDSSILEKSSRKYNKYYTGLVQGSEVGQ